MELGHRWYSQREDKCSMVPCKVFTLLSSFSLIIIELEPDILYSKRVFYMTVVTVYDKRYSCLSKTTVTRMRVTITTLNCT